MGKERKRQGAAQRAVFRQHLSEFHATGGAGPIGVRGHIRQRHPRAQASEEGRSAGEEAGYPVTNSTLKGITFFRQSQIAVEPPSRGRQLRRRDNGPTAPLLSSSTIH